MAANIEIEAKVLITKEDYEKIIHKYEDEIAKEYDQTNYYIDTPSFSLKKEGIGLRIRLSQGLYQLTLKVPMAEGLLEKDQKISFEDYKKFKKEKFFPEGNVKEFVKMLGYDPNDLIILTKLITHRIEIDDEDYATKNISIDKNDYNGITDYEIELEGESMQNTKDALKTICEECKIPYKDNLKSKQSRALETLKKATSD